MEPLKLVKYALDSTIALIGKGEEPTKALEKVSRELDLNQNYIQRVGESLNVALHFNHFTKSASDRSKDFAVANIPDVTKNIFGETEKTLNQKKAEWFRPTVESINYNKYLTDKGFKKVATELSSQRDDYNTFPTSVKGLYKQATEYISSLERDLDELKTNKVANDAYLEACFNALVNGFKKSAATRQAFHDFETKALVEYGDRAKGYVDLIYKSAGLTEARGIEDPHILMMEPTRELNLLGSLLKSASQKIELAEKVEDAEFYLGFQRSGLKQAGFKLHQGLGEFEKTAASEYADFLDTVIEKVAGPLTSSLITDLYSRIDAATYGRDKKSPPFKNTRMDDLTRSTLLQELIMTDPILKHQDPRKVIQAYQQILRLAPHLAMEREVVRSLLRSMTAAQSLGTMEANQLIEGNTSYLKQHQILHGSNNDDKKKDK